MKLKFILMIIMMTIIFTLVFLCIVICSASTISANSVVSDDSIWNKGYCTEDGTRYDYEKMSDSYYYYKCPTCGKEIKTNSIKGYNE